MTETIRREIKTNTGWGKLWRFLLVCWLLYGGMEAFDLSSRIGRAYQRVGSGIGALTVGNVAQSKILELALYIGAGVVVLGVLVYLTPPVRRIIDEPVRRPPAR